eukprot:TRINITY_DN5709_c0_g1_i1.p2 TRINITY_DN5709_c0_g1~~TRINITY_DN5709_c0_g1_i1.p2  ORF type:complete len:113 (-),score=37.66 TRINITY_DN5709_c0_g1_i1:1162-1500(-)
MDGVDASRHDGVIVVGATNRPGAIDAALLRPGRFDRLIHVPLPDEAGRIQIFAIHTRRTPLQPDVDLDALAHKAAGLTGAEIESVCREGAVRPGVDAAMQAEFSAFAQRGAA